MNRASIFFFIAATMVLSLLTFQYLGAARERSRLTFCQHRLNQLCKATQEFSATVGHLPPGTIGHRDAVPLDDWNNPSSPLYWQRVPNTSAIAIVQPYVDEIVAKAMPNSATSLTNNFENFSWDDFCAAISAAGGGVEIEPSFLCPSDNMIDEMPNVQLSCTSQPVLPTNSKSDMGFEFWASSNTLATTNFVGNGGVTGGLCNDPNSKVAHFIGPLRSRSKTTEAAIVDGTKHTFLFGETIGDIKDSRRRFAPSWALGGIGVVRGEFPASDLLSVEKLKNGSFLGNSKRSSLAGFGSRHVAGVNFVMVGGEFGVHSRTIAPEVLFALSAMGDSQVGLKE